MNLGWSEKGKEWKKLPVFPSPPSRFVCVCRLPEFFSRFLTPLISIKKSIPAKNTFFSRSRLDIGKKETEAKISSFTLRFAHENEIFLIIIFTFSLSFVEQNESKETSSSFNSFLVALKIWLLIRNSTELLLYVSLLVFMF